MASFSITTDATASGQQLTSAATTVLATGTMGGAKCLIQVSTDNSAWAPLFDAFAAPGSWIVAIPINWYVRTISTGGTSGTTSYTVVIA